MPGYIHNNILDKGAPVVLLLIEALGIAQGNISHGAEILGQLVIPAAKHGILKIIGIAHNGLEALLGEGDDGLTRCCNL